MKRYPYLVPLVLAAALLSLTACSGTAAPREAESAQAVEEGVGDGGENAEAAPDAEPAETTPDAEPAESGEAESAEGAESGPADVLVNDGLELPVPAEYAGLLLTHTDGADGVLFSVFERASVDAAKANGMEEEGPGWLFSIARMDQAALQEKLCYDMSGESVFAKDGEGRYYILQTPTDVRFERESYENIEEDMEQWSALTEWAGTVPDSFLSANPALTAEKRGNTEVDMYLFRTAFQEDAVYTLSTTEFGPMEPKDVDAAPYVDRLTTGVVYELAEGEEAPDGEYVVLHFPEDEIRFDFFLMSGQENYVRQVWGGNGENAQLYRAVADDSSLRVSEVMHEWYNALVDAN